MRDSEQQLSWSSDSRSSHTPQTRLPPSQLNSETRVPAASTQPDVSDAAANRPEHRFISSMLASSTYVITTRETIEFESPTRLQPACKQPCAVNRSQRHSTRRRGHESTRCNQTDAHA